jgi:cellulose biosynthesis protein BcsQ
MTAAGGSEKPGKIVTFYSYKGGTGRSMALANVAWVLASSGKRVLAIDWDLEAPGLHRYFEPFLADRRLERSGGVIDFVRDFAAAAVTAEARAGPDWYEAYGDILAHAIPVQWNFSDEGLLHLVPAGRQDEAYALRVNSFDWQSFYERLGGGILLEAVKQNLRRVYDFILIDSRTGVSDTSGICTIQMPDELVVCFTLNRQSMYGASSAARSAFKMRHTASGEPTLKIWPLPTRVEKAEKERLQFVSTVARARFSGLMHQLSPEEEDEYWGKVAVDYEAYYAYEEVLAAFGDLPRQTSSMLAKMEGIAARLNGSSLDGAETIDEVRKAEGLAAFTRRSSKDFEQEFAWLGDEYESIRTRVPASVARTRLMTLLVGRAQILGAYRDAGSMAETLFNRGTDGGRVVGLALARLDPRGQHIELALSCIRRSRSAFEQHQALLLAETLRPLIDPKTAITLFEAVSELRVTTMREDDPRRVAAQQLIDRFGETTDLLARNEPRPRPLIYISYAHADEPEEPRAGEVQWLSLVMKFLRPAVKNGLFAIWVDRLIPSGAQWDAEIERNLRTCDIFVFLVSPNSTASEYLLDKELPIARERHASGDLHIFPLLIEPTPRAGLETFRDFNLRPRDAKPLSLHSAHDRNQIMADVADEIAAIAMGKKDAVHSGPARFGAR